MRLYVSIYYTAPAHNSVPRFLHPQCWLPNAPERSPSELRTAPPPSLSFSTHGSGRWAPAVGEIPSETSPSQRSPIMCCARRAAALGRRRVAAAAGFAAVRPRLLRLRAVRDHLECLVHAWCPVPAHAVQPATRRHKCRSEHYFAPQVVGKGARQRCRWLRRGTQSHAGISEALRQHQNGG